MLTYNLPELGGAAIGCGDGGTLGTLSAATPAKALASDLRPPSTSLNCFATSPSSMIMFGLKVDKDFGQSLSRGLPPT